jgi:ectoine hydroxylase
MTNAEFNVGLSGFHRDGFCVSMVRFSESEINKILSEIEDVMERNPPGLVREGNSGEPRGLQGPHLLSPLLARLARDQRLLGPVKELLGGKVYVHQFKVNFKLPFVGEAWPWHQDFAYWHQLDGVPEPRLVTAMIALDEVSEFNGPLFFIPESQLFGLVKSTDAEIGSALNSSERSFSSDLPFQLSRADVSAMIARYNIVAAKGAAGSVVFFAANVAHASLPNLTPWPRRIVLITYNRTDNAPKDRNGRRPEYMCGTSFWPLDEVPCFWIPNAPAG